MNMTGFAAGRFDGFARILLFAAAVLRIRADYPGPEPAGSTKPRCCFLGQGRGQGVMWPADRTLAVWKRKHFGSQMATDPIQHLFGRCPNHHGPASDSIDPRDPAFAFKNLKKGVRPLWDRRQAEKADQDRPGFFTPVTHEHGPPCASVRVEILGDGYQVPYRVLPPRKRHRSPIAGRLLSKGYFLGFTVREAHAEARLLVNRRRNGPDIGIVAEHADEMGLAVLSDVTVDAYGTAPARNVDRKALREIPTWREGPPRCWQLVDFLVSSCAITKPGCDDRTMGEVISLTGKAVLFDMDGTLVDSTQVVERAWGLWAARHNIPLKDVLYFSHGRPTISTLEHFLPGCDHSAELEVSSLV